MNRYYEDIDIPPMNCRTRSPAPFMNWNVRIPYANPRDFYRHQGSMMAGGIRHSFHNTFEDLPSVHSNFGRPNQNRYIFPMHPPLNDIQRLHRYGYNHDDRNYSHRDHTQQNLTGHGARMPLSNLIPQQNLQESYNGHLHQNNERPTVNSNQKQEFFKKKVSSKEISLKNQEAVKKEALAAELRQSLKDFQKNHPQDSNNLLIIGKSKETTHTSTNTSQLEPCFPWDLPLTVDDLKTIGRGKTGNISEGCADSCNEKEISILERQHSNRNTEIVIDPPIDTAPEILFIKQCRKRQSSESMGVEPKKHKLNCYQSRRRHRSASPNLCEEANPEDIDGNSRQSSQDNLAARETKDDSALPPKPNSETFPKSCPSTSLMQLLGVKRREFNEMVEQPRNPRIQFMLRLLMKRHKELLLQRAIRSRFSTLRSKIRPNCSTGRSVPNGDAAEVKIITNKPLKGMGASDTIDQLSDILLESSLTVDISSLPQELIDQIGTFLEMGVDLGTYNEEILVDGEGTLNTLFEESNEPGGEVTHNEVLPGGINEAIKTAENISMPENNVHNQTQVKMEEHDDDEIRLEWDGNKNVAKMEIKPELEKPGCSEKENESCLMNGMWSIDPGCSMEENIKNSNDQGCSVENNVHCYMNGKNSIDLGSPVEENMENSNDPGSSVDEGGKNLANRKKLNDQNNGTLRLCKSVMNDSPSTPFPSDAIEEHTEEEVYLDWEILMKMWTIDQRIKELMEDKQKLYEKLRISRLNKCKNHRLNSRSFLRNSEDFSQGSATTHFIQEKSKIPSVNVIQDSLPRTVSPLQNSPSHSSTNFHHSSENVREKSSSSSLEKCRNTRLMKETVAMNAMQDETQNCASTSYDSSVNSPVNHNLVSKKLDLTCNGKLNDDPVEIIYDSSDPQDISKGNGGEFIGHKDAILAIKLVGKHLYASCTDLCVYCFHLDTHKSVKKFQGHTETITSLFVDCCDRNIHLYSGSHDKQLLQFDTKNGKILHRKKIDESIQCMEEGWGILFIGTKGGTIERYKIAKSEFMKPRMPSLLNEIMAIQTSKEGPRRVLIIATRNKPIIVRDAYSGLLLRAINDEATQHTVFAIHVHRGIVYSGTNIYGISACDFTNGKVVQQYKGCGTVVSMKVVNGKIFAASYDGNIYVYDFKCSTPEHIIKASDKLLLCLAVKDNMIYAGSLDGKLRFWPVP